MRPRFDVVDFDRKGKMYVALRWRNQKEKKTKLLEKENTIENSGFSPKRDLPTTNTNILCTTTTICN